MSVINSQPLIGASGNQGYFLDRSLRFRSSASAYLNRTLTTPTDNKKWTISAWVKIGALNTNNRIFSSGSSGTTYSTPICFVTGDTLDWLEYSSSTIVGRRTTTQVFRDPSAWYHIVCVYDSANATAANRMLVYVNGVQVTSFSSSTNPSLNANSVTNSAIGHQLGNIYAGSYTQYFDGYMAEVYFVDGQALTPSSFGETSASTGVWIPKKYTGTYGTNGFYLDFKDNSALTTSSNAGLGKDNSGNGNYWTTNNISITANSTYDSMTDVPTLTSATAANYCVFNPLSNNGYALSFANLIATLNTNTVGYQARGTISPSSGKWYFEFGVGAVTGTGAPIIGVVDPSISNTTNLTGSSSAWCYYGFNGQKYNGSGGVSYGATWGSNDNIGVALDLDNGTIAFYKNGVSQGTAFTNLAGKNVCLFVTADGGTATYPISVNCGQQPFTYTPPSGFVALNTFNLPTPTIGATASTQANDYFDATTYTATGTTQAVINSGGMQPDFVWIKPRSIVGTNLLFDSIRGATKYLESNSTNAETTDTTNFFNSFNSNGFSQGTGNYANGTTVVAWQWRASNATGVTNTTGTITSTVSANTTAGFSIVTYTGTGSNATVGHGLGVAPKMVIVKRRNSTSNWTVLHTSISGSPDKFLYLNSTSAVIDAGVVFNGSNPSSTVFSIGTDAVVNASGGTYVAYCFSEVAGYSRFGSYTGNGSSDGTFVFTGFRPKFILWKRTNAVEQWTVWTPLADGNGIASSNNFYLLPNSSATQDTTQIVDTLSNGFKHRDSGSLGNANGGTYIYMAFAESPFRYANAR